MNRLDWTVIRTGATAGLLVVVPAVFVSTVLVSDPPPELNWLFLAITVFGFMIAGYVSGKLRSDTPIAHGVLGGFLTFVVAQVFGMIVLFARGDTIVWVAIPLTALLACTFGAAGALLSDVLHRRRTRVQSIAAGGHVEGPHYQG